MKIIVAGCRGAQNRALVYSILDYYRLYFTELVCGMALHWKWQEQLDVGGADRFGYDWGMLNNVTIKPYYPEWRNGRSAGNVRNGVMAEYADGLIAFWDRKSPGTKDMIKKAKKQGLLIAVYDSITGERIEV